jgi:hypothetical protein
MGSSRSKAHYDASIAKAFTKDQLAVIASMDPKLSEEIVRELAAIKDEEHRNTALNLMSFGKNPREAIDTAVGALAAARKSTRNPEDESPDGEWLEQWCPEIRGRLGNTKAFDTSAILYRKTKAARGVFRATAAEHVKNARLVRAGDPVTRLLGMTMTIKHPNEWLVCGTCNGGGLVEEAEGVPPAFCRECQGTGFKVSFGGNDK